MISSIFSSSYTFKTAETPIRVGAIESGIGTMSLSGPVVDSSVEAGTPVIVVDSTNLVNSTTTSGSVSFVAGAPALPVPILDSSKFLPFLIWRLKTFDHMFY